MRLSAIHRWGAARCGHGRPCRTRLHERAAAPADRYTDPPPEGSSVAVVPSAPVRVAHGYAEELRHQAIAVGELADLVRNGPVALVFSADQKRNNKSPARMQAFIATLSAGAVKLRP